jgi:hypothetical protein
LLYLGRRYFLEEIRCTLKLSANQNTLISTDLLKHRKNEPKMTITHSNTSALIAAFNCRICVSF